MNFYRDGASKTSAPIVVGTICAMLVAACGGDGNNPGAGSMPPAMSSIFSDAPLVINKQEVVAATATVDANLQNPWGIATAPGLPFWIAGNNSNGLTLYSGTGTIETQQVTGSGSAGVALPASAAGVPANPTGEVYNGSGGFAIMTSAGVESALFICDGEGGTISGWAKDSGSTAVTA